MVTYKASGAALDFLPNRKIQKSMLVSLLRNETPSITSFTHESCNAYRCDRVWQYVPLG